MKKKRSKPKALLSKQWQSESTLSARASDAPEPAEASPTPSPTSAPEPCEGAGKAPKSVAWVEQPVKLPPDPPPGGDLGLTDWQVTPRLAASAFCDGEAKQFVGRVTTATGQQRQRINPSQFAMTNASIEAANCGVLLAMWGALDRLWNDPAPPGHAYTPRDVIQAHEDVHKTLATAYTLTLANAYIASVDALSASCRDGDKTITDGIAEAQRRFNLDFAAEELLNMTHKPPNLFINAHRRAAKPWLEKIRAEMVKKNCPNTPNMPPDLPL